MIPIRFPNDAEKIHREALAFRRLSPAERTLAILDLLATGATLLSQSPNRLAAEQFRQEQKALWRQANKELFARHAPLGITK
jgi:hypothetical protein